MSTITVRGLDDDVVRALKLRAAREGRSMEAEVRGILTAAVAAESDDRGLGTFFAAAFAGLGPLEVPPRSELAAPIDLA
ncbi:FitA-like ribbon-helix-helix domain-containing protein [Microbacterium xylanilyticum]